jgi:hypothetical protein
LAFLTALFKTSIVSSYTEIGDTSSFVRQTTLTQTKHEQGVMPRFGGGFRAAATV